MEEGFNFFFQFNKISSPGSDQYVPFSLSLFLLALKLSSIAEPKLRPGDEVNVATAFTVSTLAEDEEALDITGKVSVNAFLPSA